MRKVNYIIVGQGLAGTLLSWFLIKNKKSFVMVDEKKVSSASGVSAGIIHPITGRRIVKTWMVGKLLPFAQDAYSELESFIGKKLFYPLPVIELLSSPKEYNDWMARSGDKELFSYIDINNYGNKYDAYLHPFFRNITVTKSSWIDIGILTRAFRDSFLKENILLHEKFNFDLLRFDADGVEYIRRY